MTGTSSVSSAVTHPCMWFAVQFVERLVMQLDTKKKDLLDFQEKYKVRIKVGISVSSIHTLVLVFLPTG